MAYFISPVRNLHILYKPVEFFINPQGAMEVTRPAEYIRFSDNQYYTDDPEKTQFLINRDQFEVDYMPNPADRDKFWMENGYYKSEMKSVRSRSRNLVKLKNRVAKEVDKMVDDIMPSAGTADTPTQEEVSNA